MIQSSRFPLLLTLAALSAGSAHAQTDLSWFRVDDGPANGSDGAVQVEIGPDGESYVLALQTTPQAGLQGLVSKYAANGALQWQHPFALANETSEPRDMIVDPVSGDLIVVGVSGLHVGNQAQALIVRYAPDGTQRFVLAWNYVGNNNDEATSVALDANGRILFGGTTGNYNGDHVALVVALSATGTEEWRAVVDANVEPYHETFIDLDAAGNVALAASARTGSQTDLLAARIDSTGQVLWRRTFDGPSHDFDRAFSVATDADSSVYVSGVVTGPNGPTQTTYRGALVKWDAAGNLVWQHVAEAPGAESLTFYDLAVDVRGDVLVCGQAVVAGAPVRAVVEKRSGDGAPIWRRTFDGTPLRGSAFNAIDLDAFGGLVAGGYTLGDLPGLAFETDALVVRYDADGTERWAHHGLFTFQNRDHARDVRLGSSGAVAYVGSVSTSTESNPPSDMLVVRLIEQSEAYCFGDGSGTACPCGNATPVGEGRGCANSLGVGARLSSFGDAAMSNDTLLLHAAGLPNSVVLFVQSQNTAGAGAGVVFGDGLLCLGGGMRRLGTVPASGNATSFPPAGTDSISERGDIVMPGQYYYQARYRNAASFCTPQAFNMSNGLRVLYGP